MGMNRAFQIFLQATCFLLVAASVRAEDIDLFLGLPAGSSDAPNVLFVIDNTANWSQTGDDGRAAWLTEQMEERRLGRNELARESGISETSITRILRHDHIPSPGLIRHLAAFFRADPDTVMEIAGLVRLSDLPVDVPPDVRDLARRLYRLDPRDREEIVRQFDGILRLVEGRPRRLS